MKRILILISILLISSLAQAVDWKSDIVLTPLPMTYAGPADSIRAGEIIGSTWSAVASVNVVFSCSVAIWTCRTGTMEPSPSAVSSGLTIQLDSQSYTIYETGVPGIGYVIGLKDFASTEYMPLQSVVTPTYPSKGTNAYANNLGWSAKVTFVKTNASLKTGVYIIPTIEAAILKATDGSDKIGVAKVIINPTTITVSATGCTVGSKNNNINLGDVDVRTLPDIGSTSPLVSFNVSLKCDADVIVHAVVTDQSNPSNTSSIVSLTGDSTAAGVGVQFRYNGQAPLRLGPDSKGLLTPNQFLINDMPSSKALSLPFQVNYVRNGKLVPGTANALASITFSYQ